MNSLFHQTTPITPIRGVHLDLKGVPPTAERLLSLLDLFKACRINAVLVEWEDTFPWTSDEQFRNETAYTPAQVQAFHAKAASLDIEIIPLVQCLGHMQNVLDLPTYAHMREVSHLSDGLNPLAPGARELIQKMVDDVIALTPDCKYFHLGGDEAWTFGTHPDTKAYIEKNGKGALYLHHVEPILDALNQRDIRPILWHDMMADWDSEALNKLSTKADLMFWSYHGHPYENKNKHFTKAVFERFIQHHVNIWGAGAYKGTGGHNIDLPNYSKLETNSLGWVDVARETPLVGLVATAWSRYSTHQLQCEPIDACLDALVMVAAIYHDGKMPDGGLDACGKFLSTINEYDRFISAKNCMEKLQSARKTAWSSIQNLSETIAMMQADPRRRTGGIDLTYLRWLNDAITKATQAGEEMKIVFTNLIDPLWIERYLSERITPLTNQLKLLEPTLAKLNPDGFKAKTGGQ